ncbi:hypothetical protein M9Y10_011545 [Tritrichomonas musculus]|uniref:Pyruvate, phosphate dikinase n=1 Tax=Tritrichomonas musculus TaxID=1915356 RepID=A0ABR2IJQ8_9EUKA
MSTRDVYLFTELSQARKDLGKDQVKQFLGLKGANLTELTSIEGVPVPKGFTISTRACNEFLSAASDPPVLNDTVWDAVVSSVQKLEEETERKFGDGEKPLIFSCRPSPSSSMPQILQTFFNVGYNDKAVAAIGTSIENPVFAHGNYRRYLQDYATIVLKISQEKIDEVIQTFNNSATEPEELEKYETQLKELIEQETGDPFPQEPLEQLKKIIITIFESWNSDQAQEFREQNNIPYEQGTAVIVQTEVYGNLNETSGAGFVYTRNPSSGENAPTGNYLSQSTGLDLINKSRSPEPYGSLEQSSQAAFEKFSEVMKKIEGHFKNVQKIDFTVENNELWILQTQDTRINSRALFKVLVDMVNDSVMSKEESIERLSLADIEGCCPDDPEDQKEDETENNEGDNNATENAAATTEEPPEKYKLEEEQELQQLLAWSDEVRQTEGLRDKPTTEDKGFPNRGVGIRCNYTMKIGEPNENPEGGENNADPEITMSKSLGADGFVVSTENLFLSEQRIEIVRKILLSEKEEEKKAAMKELVEQQTSEYAAIFEGLGGSPCVIRLPDVSVTDFLPDLMDLAIEIERIKSRIEYGIAVEEEEKAEPEPNAEGGENENENEAEKEGDGENADQGNNENEEEKGEKEEGNEQEGEGTEKKEEVKKEEKPPKPKPIEIKQRLFEKVSGLIEENTKQGIRGARLFILFPDFLQTVLKGLIEGSTTAQGRGQQVSPDVVLPFVTTSKEFHCFQKEFDKALKDFAAEKESECPVQFRLGCEINVVNIAYETEEIAKMGAAFITVDQIGLTTNVYGYGKEESEETFNKEYKKNQVYREAGNNKYEPPFSAFDIEGLGKLIGRSILAARSNKEDLEFGICTNDRGYEETSFEVYHKIGVNYVSCRFSRLPVARVVSAKYVAKDKLSRERQSQENEESSSAIEGNQDNNNTLNKPSNDDTTTTETESTYED